MKKIVTVLVVCMALIPQWMHAQYEIAYTGEHNGSIYNYTCSESGSTKFYSSVEKNASGTHADYFCTVELDGNNDNYFNSIRIVTGWNDEGYETGMKYVHASELETLEIPPYQVLSLQGRNVLYPLRWISIKNCPKLKSITVPEDTLERIEGIKNNPLLETINFRRSSSDNKRKLGLSITSINKNAKLASLDIPDNLYRIDSICGNESLRTLKLNIGMLNARQTEVYYEDANTSSSESYAKYIIFEKNANLQKVEMLRNPVYNNTGLLSWGAKTIPSFNGCTKLESVSWPTSMGAKLYIPDGCFQDTALKSITGWATYIGKNAFRDLSTLTDMKVMPYVEKVLDYAFAGCSNLKEVECGGSLQYIGSYAFSNCSSLDSIVNFWKLQPLTAIKAGTFMGCKSLTKFTIPVNVMTIDQYAFEGCSSLGEIDFSKNDKLTEIGLKAFYNCSDATHNLTLKDGALPKNLTSLGSFAFAYSSLHSTAPFIVIPTSLATMGENPFADNHGIEYFVVNASNSNFTVKDDALFTKDLVRLICYPSKCRESVVRPATAYQGWIVPPTVHTIDAYAFQNCEDLVHVVLPSELQVLEIGTFANCTSLASITIPAKVNSIFQGAFYNCTSLKEVFAMRETPVHLDENNYDTSEIGGKPAFSGVTDCTLYTKPNMNSDNIADAYKNFSEYDGLFKEITYEIPLTIGASGYVTMARDFDVNLRSDNEDLRPYTITDFDADAGTVTLKALSVKNGTKYSTNRYVPSRVEKDGLYQLYNGVVVKGTPGKTYHVWMGVGDYSREESKRWKAVESTTNMLSAYPVETWLTTTYKDNGTDYTRFVLVDGKWRMASEAGIISANRACLSLPTAEVEKLYDGSGSSKSLSVVFDNGDGEVTGIDELQMQPAKAGEDVYYTLSGMRVTKPVRGIYIKNGKKVVIK